MFKLLVDCGVVGDLCLYYFDVVGNVVFSDEEDLVIGMFLL